MAVHSYKQEDFDPNKYDPEACLFCGSKEILVPHISIAFGMVGCDCSFCEKCLYIPAVFFWEKMFKKHGYAWPPILAKKD